MEAHIIVDEKGAQWFLVPEEDIRITVYPSETGGSKMTAVRVGLTGKDPSRNRFLRENFTFTSKFDIPDEIVQFAVEKERRMQAAVHAVLERSKPCILKCFKGWRSPVPLADVCNALAIDEQMNSMEDRLAADLLKRLPQGGGLN